MTSDHRVAGSSPATCKTSMVKDHRAIWRYKNKTIKSAVIRLLSGFPVLLASLTAHVRINPRNLLVMRIRNAFPNMKPVDNLKLTKRHALELAKYAGLVGLTPEEFLNRFLKDSLPTSGTIVMTTGTPKLTLAALP